MLATRMGISSRYNENIIPQSLPVILYCSGSDALLETSNAMIRPARKKTKEFATQSTHSQNELNAVCTEPGLI